MTVPDPPPKLVELAGDRGGQALAFLLEHGWGYDQALRLVVSIVWQGRDPLPAVRKMVKPS